MRLKASPGGLAIACRKRPQFRKDREQFLSGLWLDSGKRAIRQMKALRRRSIGVDDLVLVEENVDLGDLLLAIPPYRVAVE